MTSVDNSSGKHWCVWRLDDNGNEIRMRSHLTREEANSIAAQFTARGHKQTYWVSRQDPDASDRSSVADSNS